MGAGAVVRMAAGERAAAGGSGWGKVSGHCSSFLSLHGQCAHLVFHQVSHYDPSFVDSSTTRSLALGHLPFQYSTPYYS